MLNEAKYARLILVFLPLHRENEDGLRDALTCFDSLCAENDRR